MLLFKTNTLEFEIEFLEYVVSDQRMQSSLPAFVAGVNLALSRFSCKNDCLAKPEFSYFSNWVRQD